MAAGHAHGPRLHVPGDSVVHRAPAHVKLLALLGLVLLGVAVPAGWWAAYGVLLAVLLGVVAVSGVPLLVLVRRMWIEVPFLVFAVLLPFVATGPQVVVGPFRLSEPGLVAAGALVAKGTLGVLASLTLAATTEAADVLRGLRRLHVPDLLVQIMAFMLRYLDVVTADLARMTTAMRSRGHDPRSPRLVGGGLR